jgi:hypothetical protein
MEIKSSYYDKYYNLIINNVVNDLKDNSNLLLIVKNEFNLLQNIEFIIKKKNIKITIVNDTIYNKEFKNNMINSIQLFDKESYINIFNGLDEIIYLNNNKNIDDNIDHNVDDNINHNIDDNIDDNNDNNDNNNNNDNDSNTILFNNIIIFHINSIDHLKDKLNLLESITDKNSKLYIYTSLSNESLNRIKYKNIIRNSIIKYTHHKMGNVLQYESLLTFIDEYKIYKINSLKIYKKTNYILYGDNIVYEIILVKNAFNL